MSDDASKNLLSKYSGKTTDQLKNDVAKPSALDSLSVGNIENLKGSLLKNIGDVSNLKNLSTSNLQVLSKSFGINPVDFKSIINITGEIASSGILSGDKNAIKKYLLKQLEIGNLFKVAQSDIVKKMLSETFGLSMPDLGNLFKSSIEIKTVSDIKNMEIYKILDDVFKEKLAADNGIDVKLLDGVVFCSTKLYSKQESDQKEGENFALTLKTSFEVFFEPDSIQKNPANDEEKNSTKFLNDFDRIDYRVQKISAIALGYGNSEDSVKKMSEDIKKIKKFIELEKQEKALKSDLVNHSVQLRAISSDNPEYLEEYSKQAGVSSDAVSDIINTAPDLDSEIEDDFYNGEENELDTTADTHVLHLNVDQPPTDVESLPINIIGLDLALCLKIESTNEWDYNGDLIIQDGFFNSFDVTEFPIKFRKVNGNVIINKNGLTSLKNMPSIITGNFSVSDNKLTTLENFPKSVGGSIDISNNTITSLTNSPESCNGTFNCSNNKLTSLEGSPKSVTGNFICNKNLLDEDGFTGSPTSILGDMICTDNFIESFKNGPEIWGNLDCRRNKIGDSQDLFGGGSLIVKGDILLSEQFSDTKLDVNLIKEKTRAKNVFI